MPETVMPHVGLEPVLSGVIPDSRGVNSIILFPRRQDFNLLLGNVGPPSATLAQH